MEEKQELKVHGSFVGVLRKEDGTVTTTRKDNMILNCGYDFIADAIGKTSGRPDTMNKIVVGTSNKSVDASESSGRSSPHEGSDVSACGGNKSVQHLGKV